MCRISDTFVRLRCERQTGLVTYTTAGDPDLPRSAEVLKALDRAGADVLEVGVPFSDPVADGPVIQRAAERALASGGSLRASLAVVDQIRSQVAAPMVLFSYANPLLRMGLGPSLRRAADAGIDGVLALDLPVEEADEFRDILASAGLDAIFLLSPTTTDARIQKAAELGRGFLYGISRLGVTGARETVASGAEALVRRIRRHTPMPIALGFGISRPEHVVEVGAYADAAVVGSALVSLIAQESGSPHLLDRVESYVRWLKGIMSTLEDLRDNIDRIDEVIVRLLNERARCACEIGRLKQAAGIDVHQPDREKQVLAHVRTIAREGPLGPDAIGRLFERVIDEARRLERRVIDDRSDADTTEQA